MHTLQCNGVYFSNHPFFSKLFKNLHRAKLKANANCRFISSYKYYLITKL